MIWFSQSELVSTTNKLIQSVTAILARQCLCKLCILAMFAIIFSEPPSSSSHLLEVFLQIIVVFHQCHPWNRSKESRHCYSDTVMIFFYLQPHFPKYTIDLFIHTKLCRIIPTCLKLAAELLPASPSQPKLANQQYLDISEQKLL